MNSSKGEAWKEEKRTKESNRLEYKMMDIFLFSKRLRNRFDYLVYCLNRMSRNFVV